MYRVLTHLLLYSSDNLNLLINWHTNSVLLELQNAVENKNSVKQFLKAFKVFHAFSRNNI